MEKEKGIIKIAITTMGYLSYFLGGWGISLETLFIFMICDYISGYMKSMIKGKLSSKIGFKGLIKKASYLIAVIVGVSLDKLILENHLNIPITIFAVPISFKIMIIFSIIGTEGISIVENLAEIGIKFPFPVKKLFKQLQQDEPSQNINEQKKEP